MKTGGRKILNRLEAASYWRRVRLLASCLLAAALFCEALSPSVSAQTVAANISVDGTRVEGRISPTLYGQFAEFMFEDIKGGLHAELIRDRGFEETANVIGLPRRWERYPDDRNDDFALNFHWDDSVSYPPDKKLEKDTIEHSLRIDLAEGVIPRHGVFQSGVPVRAGLEYRGYVWLKTENFTGDATVALEEDTSGGEIYDEAKLESVTGRDGDWRKYEFILRPKKSDALSRLAILLGGRGRVWLDQVSLLPADAKGGGVRADVFEKVRALSPAFVRWPGGNVAQDYHWMWAVGPRDKRTTWTNLAWKNEAEPSDFGTDEYIEFCREIGAEPSITVNVEGRGATVEEAAAWVEYCNGPANSKYGAMRVANGHPAPYKVKYWEIGNEIWGDWVRGHSDAETYGRNFNRYYEAMRRVDPTIKFIGCGDNDMRWNETVLRLAGARMDYFAIHHYYGTSEMRGDALNLMARPLFYEHFYKEVRQLMERVVPGHAIKLNINEWNTALPLPNEHSMQSALYAARLMNVFERSGDLVEMSAVSDLVNGWPGGIIQASRNRVFVTPTYLVNMLYSNHLGAQRLATTVTGPTFDTTLEGKAVPFLDAVASRSADGRRLFIKAVNTDPQRALRTTVNLRGVNVLKRADVETLNGATLTTDNSFAAPQAVAVKHSEIAAGQDFVIELPEHSVSVITLSVR